ncbi:RagB/SusD family nutrient uptake outer membrane protein [Zhouia sp. PK063]|uniref:RagB/SusD family nutrient uptake outer membrane protein n=1 Tax=Zhouia sp. PK063 TaxID=3373602 RepID=UPI0037B410BC
MKKINFKYIFAGILFSVVLSSCNDLDRYPGDSIELSQSFKSVKDAATWNNGLYSLFRGRVYGSFTQPGDIMADQLNSTLDYGNRNGSFQRLDFQTDDQTIGPVWASYYNGITNVNVAIAGFENITPADDNEQAALDSYKGDAYFARAYFYAELAKRFCDAYDSSNAASQLGLPILLTYDINNWPARSSLQETYQQILSDIDQAKTLLSGVSGEQGANYFNEDVVLALEARVKLYMQDWTGAKTAADKLISSGTYPLIKDAAKFQDMWYEDYSQEDIMQVFVSAPNELANTNSVYLGFNAGLGDAGRYDPDFLPSQWVIDMYDDNDIRKNTYFKNLPVTIQGLEYEDLTLVNKYPGNPIYFTGANTNYEQAPKVFRIAEMYLISAEAAYKSSGDALTPLNDLRTARGLTALSGVSGDALYQAIKDERFRELAFEGFRYWDLKRWGEGYTRKDPQNLDVINVGSEFNTLSVSAGDYRFTWPIPSNDITVNTNLVQNAGY